MVRRIGLIGFLLIVTAGLAQNDSSCTCCTENHKAFDFWVGIWVVTNAEGSIAGENIITKQENGCILRENWTSTKKGYTGTSINFYNSAAGQWEQVWVDNSGGLLKLYGNRKENKMVMVSDEFEKEGKMLKNKITWFHNENGTVRQLWEVMEKDKQIAVVFDGLYQRK